MNCTSEESAHFCAVKARMIHEYRDKNPDAIKFKTLGIIEDADGTWVTIRENEYDAPKCACGSTMLRGTFTAKLDGSIETYPYWWCPNYRCSEDRHTRQRKELAEYRDRQGKTETAFTTALSKMNIPDGCYNWTLSRLYKPAARDKAHEIMKNRRSVFITGKTGVGKTFLGIGMLIEYGQRSPLNFRYENVPKLMFRLRGAVHEDENYCRIVQELEQVRVLLLDDLGAINSTDFIKDIMYQIINGRILDDKQTIVTSNLTLKEIGEQIDPRLKSRLGGFEIITVSGDDQRMKRTA